MQRERQNISKLLRSIATIIVVMLSFTYTYAQNNNSENEQEAADSIKQVIIKKTPKQIKDSIRNAKDSIRNLKPLILETYLIPDSLKYKRMILWKHDRYLNSITMLPPDTTYNDNFHDYPFMKKDVGATYLGISGSATQMHNYFNNEEFRNFKAISPYLSWSYTPETLPFYNVKTPYTELAYSGTLFANREKEESNVKFLHTQNLSPSLNFQMLYKRFGGKGLLRNEATDNRTFSFNLNYIGNRYVMHAGYLYNGIKRNENGGLVNDKDILDTTLDVRTLSVVLDAAKNTIKRNTIFLTHTYGLPIRFTRDSIAEGEGTITYFGHSFEYSTYKRIYTDNIALSDKTARDFYNNKFYINPTESNDSTRVSSFENKLFIRIQPWAKEAIVSKLDGGLGYQILNVYGFRPEFFTKPVESTIYNNLYFYAGASGEYKKYLKWEAIGRYDISGYFANDFFIDGKMRLSLYPIKEGIHLTGKVNISMKSPDWFDNYYYGNHNVWNNTFSKTSESKLEALLDIPYYKFNLFFGYSLITDKIYYDNTGTVRQNGEAISVISAYASKNFKLGILHLNNRVLFQASSNQDVIPLPTVSANLRYFIEFNIVKNVLRSQIGADVTYNTAYYAPSYNPALGAFQTQKERKIGNNPYIDIFANLQWKRASIFVKYINGVQGWPESDYFSANHYIRPQTAIKFGIHWPFYVK